MAKVLTAAVVEKLKANPVKRLEVPDGGLPGLYFVIQPSGRKSWAVRYRHGSATRKLTLSPAYPALGLAAAREKASAELRTASEGNDPAQVKREKKRRGFVAPNPDRDLVKNVAADFFKKHFDGKRSAVEVERMFKHDVLPLWGERPIQDIAKRDVIELLDGLLERLKERGDGGKGTMTNRVFAAIRKFFNWAVSREIVAVSPCAGLKPTVGEVSRDRVLTDDELRWFWRACDGAGYPFGPLFKLLLLTGQRLSEVAEMTAGEMKPKDRIWTIPRERAKNNNAHDVPLSDVTTTLMSATPRLKSKAGYLFTTTGETPVSGFSRAKENLDKAMLKLARKEAEESGEMADDVNIPPWRIHDLRRTAASGMARLGINLPVIEKLLNHTSGSFAGIVGVYQRHSFSDEKRAAIEAWSRFVVSLVEKQPSNVISLREPQHA